MILKNGKVLISNGKLIDADLKIDGKCISQISNGLHDGEEIDLEGMYVLPGFIDTHIHGAYGHRFNEHQNKDTCKAIREFEATVGVTAIAATTATSEFNDLLEQFDGICNSIMYECNGAKIAGIHAEGPFISPSQKGAMNADFVKVPNLELLEKMIKHCNGYLKIITVAPELDNIEELIKYALKNKIVVSMGHTSATFEEAEKAVLYGATQATHTFNAMPQYDKRNPGILGCAMMNDAVKCEMICDFVHLHPNACKMLYRLKGEDNINVISDSGHAAGLKISEFEVDGIKRYLKDGVVRLADGTIAGSAKTMHDGFKNLLKLGIPIHEVSKMVSYNPAKTLGIDKDTGSIEKGKCADLVIMDKDFNVFYTFVDGVCVYKR